MITISLNKVLDYEVYEDFKDFSIAGADFGQEIRKDHPLLHPENAREYIDSYYEKNAGALEMSVLEANRALQGIEEAFFKEVYKIFAFDIRDEEIKGYISIFNCNPRFLDTKEFQIFHGKSTEDKVRIAFHEALHFVFFDYCASELSKETSLLEKNSGPLWELSEIINVIIILNMPEFIALTGKEEKLFYPHLEDKLRLVKEIWGQEENTQAKIVKSFASLSIK